MGEEVMREAFEEEEDILHRHAKRSKDHHPMEGPSGEGAGTSKAGFEVKRRRYKDSVTGGAANTNESLDEEDLNGDVSDDDVIEERTRQLGLELE